MDPVIERRYEVQRQLGQGAYGIVWKAKSRRSGRTVAVKRIVDAFRNATDAQRTYREIVLLKCLSRHTNIVRVMHVLVGRQEEKDLYVVFEFMNADLHRVIRKADMLKPIHITYILFQLLEVSPKTVLKPSNKGTAFLHSGGVIHRDLKPSNVLVDSHCHAKIADFGLARCLPQSLSLLNDEDGNNALHEGQMTDYVATRWYRAPEILEGSRHYSTAVDMWSLGCILAEMAIGRALFPGKSASHQLQLIAEHDENLLKEMFQDKLEIEGIDLILRLLKHQVDRRISARDALEHSFIASVFSTKEEQTVMRHDEMRQIQNLLSEDDERREAHQYVKLLLQFLTSKEHRNKNK